MVAVVQGVGVEQKRRCSDGAQSRRRRRRLSGSGPHRIVGPVVACGAERRDRKHEISECRFHRGILSRSRAASHQNLSIAYWLTRKVTPETARPDSACG